MNVKDSANNQIVYDDWDIVSVTSTIPAGTPNTTNYAPGFDLKIDFDNVPGGIDNPIPITVTMKLRDKKKINEDITITKVINVTYDIIPGQFVGTMIHVSRNGSEYINHDAILDIGGGVMINYNEWEVLSISATNSDIPTLSARVEMSGPPANNFKIITKSTNPITLTSVGNTYITIVLKHKHGLPNASISKAFSTTIA